MSTASWIESFFSTDLYTITRTGGTAAEYYTDASYSIDFVDSIEVDGEIKELPLALLFCLYQIAFSDLAAAKAEDYLAKIEGNQELQSAANTAIADVEALKETIPTDVDAYIDDYIATEDKWYTIDDWNVTFGKSSNTGLESLTSITLWDNFSVDMMKSALIDAGYVAVYAFSDSVTNTLIYATDNICTAAFYAMSEDGIQYYVQVVCTAAEGVNTDDLYDTVLAKDQLVVTVRVSTQEPVSILTATLEADSDILKACELADITKIDGVAITAGATLTSDQLDTLIEELELAEENASSSTQTDMVYAEEYLGQYNSYLTGSSSTLDDFNTSIMSIAGRIG